ncbi:diguanylate cyclase [Aeromonas cavernicola]|uniref:diguanylate cyclase n=1 Tax=Aeromonas cavernicola TaxID=1006623 RepID=A0A2H9U995_9GAMM|nr:GGDEF domain-containing protein [Aeromonas cavernicola]PJG60559.1 GGDEF domain-containing protein [Aeromonas cavernicola]
MLSADQRRAPSTLIAHLDHARREAIANGMVWFWLLNLLALFFISVRYEVYRDAGLTKVGMLPWPFDAQIGLATLLLMLLPVIWQAGRRLPDRQWLHLTCIVVLIWGTAWAVHIYAIGQVELRGGESYANGILRIHLLAALVALYPSRRIFYCYISIPILFDILIRVFFPVNFIMLQLLGLACGIISLEIGRRILNRWFELACVREYENLQLLRRLELLADQDPLTGLANRRHLNRALEQALAHCAVNSSPFALILIDVDYFKRYNDYYGHQAGDSCLKELAQILLNSVRSHADLVARYGGEEFMLLLPDADLRVATEVAARLQLALARLQLEHLASDVCDRVTVSQGVACWHSDESSARLVERADLALYQAKLKGRNQFRVAL